MKQERDVDVVVVGAGLGGLYAIHKLRGLGLEVLGLEMAEGLGGVWRHNRYPGARVDLESIHYSYHFDPEIYRSWRWAERYASQDELLRYLEFVADRLDLKRHIRFSTPMTSARWRPELGRYEIAAGHDLILNARFLVMATGQLSEPRANPIPGVERFRGEVIRSSRWPDRPIGFAGKRVAVVGTGSSGVQIATELAGKAAHLHVFQRSPNYSVPAQNGPLDDAKFDAAAADPHAARKALYYTTAGTRLTGQNAGPAASYTPEEQQARLERQWLYGGQGMGAVFSDQTTDKAVNDIVAEFVRGKIRSIVKDQAVAEKLLPDFPFGTRRLIIDTGYYEIFNRPDVTLVDVAADPIAEISEAGLKTASGAEYEVDVIILALGFQAFVGAIDKADIRNERGESPVDRWSRGPKTLLGVMTAGFPNLFLLTAPGSPSVLSNMFLINEHHTEWVADCLTFMADHGYTVIEPDEDAEARWTEHVQACARRLLRLNVDNYMVHVNADGTRSFMPYTGGLGAYIDHAQRIADAGYEGFVFSPPAAPRLTQGAPPAEPGAKAAEETKSP